MNSFSRAVTKFLLVGILCLSFSGIQAQTVVEKIGSNNQINEFAVALKESNLEEKLQQPGPFTLFVPTNQAFGQLSGNSKYDTDLLLNHVFTGMATERSLKVMSEVTCLSGQTLRLSTNNDQSISVNSYQIIKTNIRADNGVIHIINGVIQ